MLPFEDVCMPALELKAREVEAIPLGLFWLLTKLCSPLCFCQEDTNGLIPSCSTTFRMGEASSCWPRSQRALFRPWSLLPSCHQKKNPGTKVRRRAAKHGDAGGAGDGAASRGLIYRRCPKRALRPTGRPR